ncbi:MAG: pectate lyase [Ignavibacteriales bacterium]|nr:MAG: pectate lyase [Ignavibacteriales bacterium]
MHKCILLIASISFISCAQEYSDNLSQFYDSAHHWYDVRDEKRMIDPLPDQERYDPSEVGKIADNILLFQKNNGGWAKNYDMRAVLTAEQTDAVLNGKDETNTTFDNGTTYSQINYLAYAFTEAKDERFKDACIKGIEYVLEAQYDNGGWPQFYPDLSGYRKYITFNDGSMTGIMDMLHMIVKDSPRFSFLDYELRSRVKTAFDKGIDCILKCQIEENGLKNVWCQQHDNVDFKPQNARSFEPAAICNGESAYIVKLLMSIDDPSAEIINSVQSAVRWFEESKINGIKVEEVDSTHTEFIYHSTDKDKVVIEDPNAPPIWARFYELGTHKPLFCKRDGTIVYTMAEVERERRTGYAWYIDWPQEVLDLYPEWKRKYAKE